MSSESLAGRVDAIVLGASAGGVEALGVLLPALPADFSVPLFIVLHLPRDQRSLLPDIYAPRCSCPVREAQDKESVVQGTVYFAPPNYHVLIDDGPRLALSADQEENYSRPSIDVLFQSAVDVYGARLAGIVLTGASPDGSAGLVAVNEGGGICIVQNPAEAQVATMPQSALDRVAQARVLTLSEIARLLATLSVKGVS